MGHLGLNPVVGVLYEDVEEILFKLEELPVSRIKLLEPTIVSSIGNIMPERRYKEWTFVRDTDVRDTANEMVDAIIKYGFPYMEEMSDKEETLFRMEADSSLPGTGRRDYLIPVMNYLYGRKEHAIQIVNGVIERRIKRYNAEMADYRQMQALYGEDRIQLPPNVELEAYMPFVERFTKLVENGEL